jgi:hypothetical protein
MSQEQFTLQEWHNKQAVDLFNETWTLIDNTDRSDEETFLMIHSAHASRYHWTKVGTALNIVRGEWLISRVYAILGMGDQALLHGQYGLDLCQDNNIQGFDLAFAYESIARAAHLLEDPELFDGYYRMAQEVANNVEKPEDKSYLLRELKTIK